MIGVIDYGMGNISSVMNILKRLNTDSKLITNPALLAECNKIILPGVGKFDEGIKHLKNSGMFAAIQEYALSLQRPILGICLGMQLLATSSEEGPGEGLNLIPGIVKKFVFEDKKLKIPHMGWNRVFNNNKGDPSLGQLLDGFKFYFVHSYYYVADDKDNVLLTTNYGGPFTSAVIKNNIIGVQFHPEKSHKYGMQLFQFFVNNT